MITDEGESNAVRAQQFHAALDAFVKASHRIPLEESSKDDLEQTLEVFLACAHHFGDFHRITIEDSFTDGAGWYNKAESIEEEQALAANVGSWFTSVSSTRPGTPLPAVAGRTPHSGHEATKVFAVITIVDDTVDDHDAEYRFEVTCRGNTYDIGVYRSGCLHGDMSLRAPAILDEAGWSVNGDASAWEELDHGKWRIPLANPAPVATVTITETVTNEYLVFLDAADIGDLAKKAEDESETWQDVLHRDDAARANYMNDSNLDLVENEHEVTEIV